MEMIKKEKLYVPLELEKALRVFEDNPREFILIQAIKLYDECLDKSIQVEILKLLEKIR